MTPGLVPGQVYVGLGVLGLALLCIVNGWLIVLIVFGVAREVRRGRREAAVLAQADVHLDEALADPEVQACLARLDAVVRGQRKGEGS